MLQSQSDVSAMGEERGSEKKEKGKRRELGNEAKSMNFGNWQLGHHFLLE